MKRFKNVLLVAHGGSGGEAPFKRAVSLAKTPSLWLPT